MAALIDTNVLVYLHDHRFPSKQRTAHNLIGRLLRSDELRVAHQSLLEFYVATTRIQPTLRQPLLSPQEARVQIHDIVIAFDVLYPVEQMIALTLLGSAVHGLSWFDAHLWSFAEYFGCELLYSEDFQHERRYGSVRIINPFDETETGSGSRSSR
jgi:predicted nucleic acid-binding protein